MKYLFNSVLVLTLLSSSCGKGDDPLPNAQLLDLESFKSIDMSPGVRDTAVKLSDGSHWNFQISVPENVVNKRLPLVIALHWAGNSETYKEYMQCLVIPGFADFDAIIVAPTDANEYWWQAPMADKLLEFVKLAKAYWPVITEKVAVTGYSNGGTGSWYFAVNHPTEFSAAIPMAGLYTTYLDKIDMPMYIIHGDRDELFPWRLAKLKIDYALNLGSEIEVDLAEGRSHFEACAYVPYLNAASKWLSNSQWKE